MSSILHHPASPPVISYHIEVPIAYKGGHVTLLIDAEDAHLVSERRWYVFNPANAQTMYLTSVYVVDGVKQTRFLHRVILAAEPEVLVDHVNGNGLDCRRKNLRTCTHRENLRNRAKQRNETSSRFKGVYWCKRNRKWRAQIQRRVDGRHTCRALGYFDNEGDAARAYDAAAVQTFGEFARLNLPDDRHEGGA